MKISLITACYNSEATIGTAIDLVFAQRGVDVEYIIVDGGSTDGTVEIIREYSSRQSSNTNKQTIKQSSISLKWLSEKDHGMYDAINKGIKMATGDVVGILNADDVLASDEMLKRIAEAFESGGVRSGGVGERVDCVYADIRFVKRRDAASPSQGGIDGGCSSQHLKRRDAASPSQGGESPSDVRLSCKGG